MTYPDVGGKKALVKMGKSPEDCWEWIGKLSTSGYPTKTFTGREVSARRWLWVQLFGPLAESMKVSVKCGNSTCVNPAHFCVCTQAEANQAGINTKLTPGDVAEIKAYKTGAVAGDRHRLAARYDVSPNTISAIWGKHRWSSVRKLRADRFKGPDAALSLKAGAKK